MPNAKLPYLKELNVSTIYLSPIFEANSSHKYDVADYSKIDKVLQERKSAGAYQSTEFSICELKEYKVESTSFSEPVDEMPFGETPTSPWFN